jgi:Ca-activated chloride channel family protein
MNARDAVPNRLAVAVESAVSLVTALAPVAANRAAVVAFAGRGVPRCPLTENLGAVLDNLRRLQVGSIRPGGTDLGAGLDAALEAFGEREHAEGRSIVIFSDGEDLVDRWRSRLDRLVGAGVIVHVVAIGDAEQGHPVPSGNSDEPLTFEGQKVLSKREDAPLEEIASVTGGAVLKLGLAPIDLGRLYRGRIAPVARLKREALRVPERAEQFPLFLAAAIGFAMAGSRPAGRLGLWRWAWNHAGVLLLVGMEAAYLGAGQGSGQREEPGNQVEVVSKAGSSAPDSGLPASHVAQIVEQGQMAYATGNLSSALASFESAILAAPLQPVPRYNAAAALFQLKRYEEALQRYNEASQRAGAGLRTKIDYALGNTALLVGDLPAAVGYYDRCLASRAVGPDLDSIRADAAVNRQFALEQASHSIAPEGETENDQAEAKKRNRPPGASKSSRDGDEPTAEDPSGTGPPPDGANPDDRGEDRPPGRGRRTGGGGGASKTPGASGDSPDDRLDDALDQIRDARQRRLPEDSPSEPAGENRKDW